MQKEDDLDLMRIHKKREGEFCATLQEVATELGLTRERVRQIETRGLEKLKKALLKKNLKLDDIL